MARQSEQANTRSSRLLPSRYLCFFGGGEKIVGQVEARGVTWEGTKEK